MPTKSSEITGTAWSYAVMNNALWGENTSSIQPWADEYKKVPIALITSCTNGYTTTRDLTFAGEDVVCVKHNVRDPSVHSLPGSAASRTLNFTACRTARPPQTQA